MPFEIEVTLLVAVLFLLSCIFLGPLWFNRNDFPPGLSQNKCVKHINDPAGDPKAIPRPDESLKIIRLTNSGEFVDRCELTNALYELNWDRAIPEDSFGANRREGAQELPKLAVLYIHGWKHDANKGDSDLQHFERLIRKLRKQHEKRKHVVGIYVGWNATADVPGPLENLSFWVKKSNADRIAQSAIVTKIVSAIGSIVQNDPKHRDQFIAIGHSFGARILFSATAQSLVYEAERSHPKFPGGEYGLVRGAANSVILLNAAFEASRFSAMDDTRRNDENFAETQLPLLVSISTNNDWATKGAFRVGQWLGSRRSERELTSIGNYAPFVTHYLKQANEQEQQNNAALTEDFYAAGLALTRLSRQDTSGVVHAYNPFIVAQTNSAVIDGHNGIWAESFTNWLVEFIAALESHADKAVISSSH